MFQNRVKVTLLALLAAFMLALSGCGGSGSTTATTPVDPPPMMECPDGQVGTYPDCMDPPPTAEERIAAAQGRAGTAATNARADADAAAMLDHQDDTDVAAAVTAAEDAAKAAEIARDLADDATNPDAAEALATQAETAEGNADTALGNARTASAAAQTAMDTAARIAATTKTAETKEKAIEAEGAQGPGQTPANPDAGLGGSDHVNADGTADNADDPYELSIKRDRTGTTIGIKDFGMDDEDEDPQFTQAMDLGNGRTMHVRDNGKGVEEVVVVRTDIEEPEAVKFADFENAAGTETQTLTVRADGETVSEDDPADSHELAALAATTPTDVPTLALIMSSSFTSNAQAVLTFGGDDPADEDDVAFKTSGTYNGAMGTYMCAGGATDCTVSIDDKGKISAISDGWIFTPDTGATSDQPDYDYLHYGFWLMKTTKDGAVTYNEVETFAGSSIAASGAVSTVTGKAEYSGGATGVYVHEVVKPDGSRESATSGHFTADANLAATFGQVTVDGTGTIAGNLLNTVTGTIDSFDLSGGEANTWSVALSGSITAGDGTAAGTAKGGGVDNGSFNATFHGPLTAAADGTIPKPHSVVGEFNAEFTNGSVAGAFGAREVEED